MVCLSSVLAMRIGYLDYCQYISCESVGQKIVRFGNHVFRYKIQNMGDLDISGKENKIKIKKMFYDDLQKVGKDKPLG